jgi:hypothetical protein
MPEIRAGGHVIGEHGWEPASLQAEEPAKPLDKLNKAELLEAAEAAGVEADEGMTKKQIVEALESD